jgi:outer membrane lipoprotein SlyB
MKGHLAVLISIATVFASGCADTRSLGGGADYGQRSGEATSQSDREGYITTLENIEIDKDYKLGIGTAVGAIAGGLLGSKASDGKTGTVAGAVVGAAAGTYAQNKLDQKDAQRVTVQMHTGGQVVIVQPINKSLSDGMNVRVEGSGETARVVRS